MSRIFILALFILGTSALVEAVAREWTDSTGTHKIEAEYISFKNGKVYLEKPGGEVITVPLDKLSQGDREFVAGKSAPNRKLDANPEFVPAKSKSSSTTSAKSEPKFTDLSAPAENRSGEVRRFNDLGWGVKSLAFSQTGGILAAGKTDRCLILFGLKDSQKLTMVEDLNELGQVTCCLFSPDNSKLVVGGSSGRIIVWKVDSAGNLKPHSEFYGHHGDVLCLAVSADGKRVLSGDQEKVVFYWDIETGEEIHSFPVFEGSVKDCFMTKSGKQGLASDGGSLILFDLVKGEAIQSMELVSHAAHAVAISPDGRKVAVSNGYAIHVWDTKSGNGFLLQDQEISWTLRFSPDGRKILAGGRAKVSVWDLIRKNRTKVFDIGKYAYVQSLAVSPDNQHIAAIGSSSGQDLQVLRLPSR